MKTILAAKKSISQIWGYPKPKEVDYRLMKYLLQIEVEDGLLLHNNVTGHMVLLTKDEARLLSDLPAKPTEQMQELIENHFLVPNDFDECKSVTQLRKIFQSRSSNGVINHYVILPTTFCNAHCFYCYESGYPHVHMTEETGCKVIDYIAEHHQGKAVRLGWFGGEPLLGLNRIDQISSGLKERGIEFTASMISNGYLFDEEIIERSVKLWNLEYVQITLDGTEKVYNEVKAYAKSEGSPYQRVLRNIDKLSDNGITVAIRLNLDFYNKQELYVLIDELGKRYSVNQNVRVYVSILYAEQGYEPVHHSEKDYLELLHIHDEYSNRLLEMGIGQERRRIPQLRFHQCMADDPHSVMIQPDGGLCRCEHEDVTEKYGSIDNGILDPQKPLLWMERANKSAFCPVCCMFPYCYLLRRCMGADEPCNEDVREFFRIKHEKWLLHVYHQKKEEEENERICDS